MNQHDRRSRALTYLAEIAHVLSMTEAMEIVLPLILDRVQTLYATEAAAFVGVVPERQEFVLLAVNSGIPNIGLQRDLVFPRSGTLLDRAFTERAPLGITVTGAGSLDPIVQALLGGSRVEGGYVVPLRVAGAERGGMTLVNPRVGGDSTESLRELISFSDLAAVAIDRAKLRRTRSDGATRLKVLNAVLKVTSAGLGEETLIRRAMEALLSSMPADRVELVTTSGEDLKLRFLHGAGGSNDKQAMRARRQELHRRVVTTGTAISETSNDNGVLDEEPYLACVPLMAEDRALGSLLLARYSIPFESQEIELLGAVGGHIGVAVELSRLLRRQATTAESLERALAESATALRETRERLATVEEERSRIQSLASLGELAAGVAHDLNNALNPVVAFAELIQEHSNQPERVQMYADRILLAARGGAETVRRIQRFTRRRLGELPFEPISVSSMISEVIDLTRPSWSKREKEVGIAVSDSVEPDLRVQGNPGELRQALLNLVGNALDAMPGGGTLRFVARAENDEALLAVQDTGTGMPRSVFDRALEPFFTTKGARGTGLGLAEVFGIARRHGGTLELETHEGVGTTVLMRLPRTRTPPPPAKVRRRLTDSATQLHHILLVDDSLLSLEATAAALRAAGHTVATAPNAQIALRIFTAGHYDLVLSDLGLPDMHGLDLVDRLRRLDPKLRVGVITGWTIPEGDEELRRRGIDLLFVKPIDTDQLLEAL
jgi:signal transduction histidine kinase